MFSRVHISSMKMGCFIIQLQKHPKFQDLKNPRKTTPMFFFRISKFPKKSHKKNASPSQTSNLQNHPPIPDPWWTRRLAIQH